MKTIATLAALVFFIIPCDSYGQRTETPAHAIARLEDLERISVMKGDTAMLFKLWSPGYVVNNPNNMILTGAQIKGFVRNGGMDSTTFTRNMEKISFINDLAIVMGSEIVAPKNKSDNAGKNIIRRYTNVWIKSYTSWKLAARQATNIIMQ
ncbi:MAG: nuclear transport factor 2 family protein [Chitinophagaceae bacterium]